MDPKNADITLIDLAFESGFDSKTVFNTYFEKETGISPKQYFKQLEKLNFNPVDIISNVKNHVRHLVAFNIKFWTGLNKILITFIDPD